MSEVQMCHYYLFCFLFRWQVLLVISIIRETLIENDCAGHKYRFAFIYEVFSQLFVDSNQ
jgi:hypothetical protein